MLNVNIATSPVLRGNQNQHSIAYSITTLHPPLKPIKLNLCILMISPRCSMRGSVSLDDAKAMHLSLSLSTSSDEASQTPKDSDQSRPDEKGAFAAFTYSTTPKMWTELLTLKLLMGVYLSSGAAPVRGATVAVGVLAGEDAVAVGAPEAAGDDDDERTAVGVGPPDAASTSPGTR